MRAYDKVAQLEDGSPFRLSEGGNVIDCYKRPDASGIGVVFFYVQNGAWEGILFNDDRICVYEPRLKDERHGPVEFTTWNGVSS